MEINKVRLLLYILCVWSCNCVTTQSGDNVNHAPTCPRKVHRRAYHKAVISYYANSSSTFRLPIICCGDIQPNPGPEIEMKSKTQQPNQTQNARRYSINELYYIRSTAPKTDLPQHVWNTIGELNIRRLHRRTRGGTRKHRHTWQAIPTIVKLVRVKPRTTVRKRNLTNLTPIPPSSTRADGAEKVKLMPSFLLCNARSANNKLDELGCVLANHDIDICAVTETWFRHDLPPRLVSIPEYHMFAKSRQHRLGGGVALYVKHHLNATFVRNIIIPADLEVVWIQLHPNRLPRSISCLFCAVIYYPQPDRELEIRLTEHIISTIDSLTTTYPDASFVILGDFNQLDTAPILTDRRFQQIVGSPTRGEHILDKIITNVGADLYSNVQIHPPIGQSDHNTVLWYPKSRQTKCSSNKTRYRMTRPMPDSAIRSFGT